LSGAKCSIHLSLASRISDAGEKNYDLIHSSWKILLLLTYFSLFWHTGTIVTVKEWDFSGFLFMITGPILIFFATTLLLREPIFEQGEKARDLYFSISRRFFFCWLHYRYG
jgi:hypothetical protein